MNKKLNILFLSNMMETKGVWILLDACKILNDEGVSFVCNFVGKWSDIDESAFTSKVKSLAIEHCIVAHGAKYNEDKQLFFDEADIFVFPTFYHNEAFSLVLLEAMQNRLPCIATREGGIPDIIDDGSTGFLINQKAADELASKLKILYQNPQLRISMGKNGYEKFIRCFTLKSFESKLSKILFDCCR